MKSCQQAFHSCSRRCPKIYMCVPWSFEYHRRAQCINNTLGYCFQVNCIPMLRAVVFDSFKRGTTLRNEKVPQTSWHMNLDCLTTWGNGSQWMNTYVFRGRLWVCGHERFLNSHTHKELTNIQPKLYSKLSKSLIYVTHFSVSLYTLCSVSAVCLENRLLAESLTNTPLEPNWKRNVNNLMFFQPSLQLTVNCLAGLGLCWLLASTMSCLHKSPKRTKSQEKIYQEQCKKAAQENGKLIGMSPSFSFSLRKEDSLHSRKVRVCWLQLLQLMSLSFLVELMQEKTMSAYALSLVHTNFLRKVFSELITT